MAITSRQFEQLSEMGISLWQKNSPHNSDDITQSNYQTLSQQDLSSLAEQTIFTDILLSFNLSIGEVSIQKDHLDVGLFNWYFTKEETVPSESTVYFNDNQLISPSIDKIAQSFSLKKQLWHTIANNLLS